MALSSNQKLYICGFAAIAIFCVAVLAFVQPSDPESAFGGSDDAGGDVAADYDYEPWTGDILTLITGDDGYELPGETESMLFAVQAAIGAIIIGYFIGFNAASKKKDE